MYVFVARWKELLAKFRAVIGKADVRQDAWLNSLAVIAALVAIALGTTFAAARLTRAGKDV